MRAAFQSMSENDKSTEHDQAAGTPESPARAATPSWVDLAPSLRRILGDISRTQDTLREQVLRAVVPAPIAEQLREQINSQLRTLIEPAPLFADRVARQFDEAMPANWRGMDSAQFWKVMDLCASGRIAVVWVPRSEVVIQLTDTASHAERERVLINHRALVLDDVANALVEATADVTTAQTQASSQATEAIEAARAGFDRAAQTLLASALGHLLEGALGFERPGSAHKEFKQRDLDEATLTELRLVCLQLSTVNALTDTRFAPLGFNRHGTQHGSPNHFSGAAMLGAALLVAGWIRELSWLAEHRPAVLTDRDTSDT
jgi:hypothetical protein